MGQTLWVVLMVCVACVALWLSCDYVAPVTIGMWQLVIRNANDPDLSAVVITGPTASDTYDAGAAATLTTLAGTAGSRPPITSCEWEISPGGSRGTASGTSIWSVASIALAVGTNRILVSCLNAIGLTATDTLVVTRSGGGGVSITGITGTVTQGSAMVLSGQELWQDNTTDWDSFFKTAHPNASSFEGATRAADGYDGTGPTGGTYQTSVKLFGSQSIKFHAQGASSNCPTDNLGEYNDFNFGASHSEFWARCYVRWNLNGGGWPRSHIKCLYTWDGLTGQDCYFQPAADAGGSFPTQFLLKCGAAQDFGNIPSGQLVNGRWYCLEMHVKNTPTRLYRAYIDGTDIGVEMTPSSTLSAIHLEFGLVNLCLTDAGFDLDHYMDGLAISTSRVYPASLVEISANSDMSGTTHVQAMTLIADTSLQFTLNITGLGAGPYYVRVTNNEQQQSNIWTLTP